MSTALRNFILTFALCMILFIILGYVFIHDIYPDIKESGKEPEQIKVTDWTMPGNAATTAPEQVTGYSFTEAFFCIDNRNELCASAVICVNDAYHSCVRISIPVDKHIEVAGMETTVADFYRKNTSSEGRINRNILSLYKSLTGYEIDKYFVVSYSSLGDIAELFSSTSAGALTYTPQSKIQYKDPLYDTVSVINPDAERYVTENAKVTLTVTKELLTNLYSPGKKDMAYPIVHPDSENEVSKMMLSLYKDIFDKLFISGKVSATSTVTSMLLTCIGNKGTNLSGSELSSYSKYIFASLDSSYSQHSIDYNSYLRGSGMKVLDWENAVPDIARALKSK
ncbi:MAG: hypothetical protein IJS94_01840 [Clostridia bacterium]|nr:hypothetical protein [Clostridia bacterium]